MRHRGMLAPINSIKHYVQAENQSVADGTRRVIAVATAKNQFSVSGTGDVVEGSIVKAIFLEIWFKGNAVAGTEDKFQFALEKVPAGQTSITFTQLNNLMAYPNKKNILFYSQGVTGDLTTGSIPIVRNWFKIPKGKQRMGLGDTIVVSVSTTGATANVCGFSTYKEYK